MAAEIPNWDLSKIKYDLLRINRECVQRGLLHSGKWAAELIFTLNHVQLNPIEALHVDESPEFVEEFDKYILAKSYFDLREYDRAAHLTEDLTSSKTKFLHWYAKYFSGEKKKLDDVVDSIWPSDVIKNESLRALREDLQKEHLKNNLDGFCLYLYGVVLKKLDLKSKALEILLLAIQKQPLHWGAWLELAVLITDKDMLHSLVLPNVWVKQFFLAHAYVEMQLNEEALEIYNTLRNCGFSRSTYIMAQIAIAYHNMRDIDQAVEVFQQLRVTDPYRLDNMDIYSNLLYVKEMRVDLGNLAHDTCVIDKYRVETCCVIGNFYSLRAQHEKAVLYFQRALKLNPNYLSAWTLMGHEYMEMKNTAAAIQSYRQAIEVNQRDYRAWYGLGQTYEILKMHYYCLYYYRQAQQLRPNDSRMLVALGEAYEKLNKLQEAKKCFWKAHCVGDIEGIALVKLAKLYIKLGADQQAAAAFTEYIKDLEYQGINDRDEQWQAYKYLAEYYLKCKKLDEAYINAQKCTESVETRDEGNALLRQVALLRGIQDDASVSGEEVGRFRPGRIQYTETAPTNLSFTS